MSIIGFIPNPESAMTSVAWIRTLVDEDEKIIFLCLETGFTDHTAEAVRAALDEQGEGGPTLITINDPMPVAEVIDHVRKMCPRLLYTAPFDLPSVKESAQTSNELLRTAPCETFLPIYGTKPPSEVKRILLVVTGQLQDQTPLALVERLRQQFQAHVTIGGVEDETGAEGGRAGELLIQALLHDGGLDPKAFESKVVVDRLKHRGIVKLFKDHDLVIVGFDSASHVRPLQKSLGDATVAIVRPAPALRRSELAKWLPRINPADHADLRASLRIESTWGPDFVGMLGLASAIASLGLLQASPAGVIGSLLLAPLLTPMIGFGLALGQADVRLARHCGKSIGLGFLLTLLVSYLIGIMTPSGETLPGEVLARGGANILDLLIAVFAAAAATFALARPNISGAIAGVAIATALVPPVCSVGISLAAGAWMNGFGAALLFFTNLVAIIVTSSFTFSLLGVPVELALPRYRRRALVARLALVVLLLVLAGPLWMALHSQLKEGKNVAVAHPVTREVARALYARVAQDTGVEIMLLARSRTENRVLIQIAAHEELPTSYAEQLTKIVRDKMHDPDVGVTVVAVRGLWSSDSDQDRVP
jgi:uncharacterized hydrophobic protein (TIGR00271 family)